LLIVVSSLRFGADLQEAIDFTFLSIYEPGGVSIAVAVSALRRRHLFLHDVPMFGDLAIGDAERPVQEKSQIVVSSGRVPVTTLADDAFGRWPGLSGSKPG
jgi:hypothetical protein